MALALGWAVHNPFLYEYVWAKRPISSQYDLSKTWALATACLSSLSNSSSSASMVLGWLTSRNGKGRGFFFGRSVVDHDLEFEGLELIARRKRVVLPTHPYRIAWDWALIVFVLYSAVSVPMEVCFRYEKHISISMFDRFVDVFFFCDLLINFRTAFVKGDGTLEIEPTLDARQ